MSGDILGRIDAAVHANLCGCGCGQQIPDRGPSPDFVNEKHQQAWQDKRRAVNRPPGDWYDELRRATGEMVVEAWRTAQAPTVRRGGIRFHIDGTDCPIPENCSFVP